MEIHGLTGNYAPEHHPDDSDFVQAGNLYRLMSAQEKERLVRQYRCASRAGQQGRYRRALRVALPPRDNDYGERVLRAVLNRRAKR
jgi:catalase